MAKQRMKKLTVLVPEALIRKATRTTKKGITPTVRRGLQLVAAEDVYERFRKLRGKFKLGMTWQELREK